MANLTNINRLSQSTFNQIINGTHSTEAYDDSAIYEVELDDPISVGEENTGLVINEDNQLVVDLAAGNIPSIPLSKISDVTATAAELNKLDGVTTTTAQLNYLNTATSNIQTQLNNKLTANTAITAGTSSKVTFDTKGLITAFAALLAADIPGVAFTTTTPTAANTDGMKFAVLSTAPATKYDGWFYIITSE